MMFCPVCDGQGVIYKAEIKNLNLLIYICDECEAMWKSSNIGETNFEQYGPFMKENGLKGLWTELSNIEIYDI